MWNNELKKGVSMLIAFVIMVLVNYLSFFGVFGESQKVVSANYDTYITPAGYAFSIWGVIYILILAMIIYMMLRRKGNKMGKTIDSLIYLIIANFIINTLWVIAFGFGYMLTSVFLIIVLLIDLILINFMILARKEETNYIFPTVVFGIYTAWISIATVVNINAYFVKMGRTSIVWSIILLILGVVLVCGITYSVRNILIPLVAIWPLCAIIVKTSAISIKFLSVVAIVIMIAVIVARIVWDKRKGILI